jgi:hypothetical protein
MITGKSELISIIVNKISNILVVTISDKNLFTIILSFNNYWIT